MTDGRNSMLKAPDPYASSAAAESTTKNRGRIWFFVSTMIGFIGFLFTNHYYHTGRGVIAYSLWQCYLMEARNGFPSLMGAELGGPQNAIVTTFVIHLGLSIFLGLIVYGVRCIVRRGQQESRTQS